MLQVENSSQIEHALTVKTQRLQLTESLQDYFALNPKAYKRADGPPLRSTMFYPDDSETSQSHTSTSSRASSSLDETTHVRRQADASQQARSLDTTFHAERAFSEVAQAAASMESHVSTRKSTSSSGRRVRWATDYDSSEGTIE